MVHTATARRADIALGDTVRIEGESFCWVVDGIAPGNVYAHTADSVSVIRVFRSDFGLRTVQMTIDADRLPLMRLTRKGNVDQDDLDEAAGRYGFPALPPLVGACVLREGRVVVL
jgi:hypothetical protein